MRKSVLGGLGLSAGIVLATVGSSVAFADYINIAVSGQGTYLSGETVNMQFSWGGTGPFDVSIQCTDPSYNTPLGTTNRTYAAIPMTRYTTTGYSVSCTVFVDGVSGSGKATGTVTWQAKNKNPGPGIEMKKYIQ